MEFDRAVAELNALVDTLEREGDERALMMLELIDAIHRPAIAQLAAGDPYGPLAQALLTMYDLAEPDDALTVEEALDQVRPYIESHGGAVEVLGVDAGVVRLRMSGACDGCAASAMTLQRGIEAALRDGYPEFREVIAEQPEKIAPAGGGLLQIEGLDLKQPVFVDIGADATFEEGRVTVAEAEGIDVLLADVGGELYAFRDGCPVDGRSLAGSRLSEAVILCPRHGCEYDARSGKRLDGGEGAGLRVLPIAVRDGRPQVAVNVA